MDPLSTTPSPEKHIRTFAGDMRAAQESSVPSLVPPPPAPPAPPSPPQAQPQLPPQTPVPSQSPVPNPVKTYESDFIERVRETHASTASIVAAEQDAGPRVTEPVEEKFSRVNLIYSIAGGALLLAGGTGAYITYTHYAAALAPVVLVPTASAPIFVDDREQISGTGDILLQAIEKSVARPLAPNAVRLLLTPSVTSTSIFSALNVSAPGVLTRNVNATGSMAGVVSAGGGSASGGNAGGAQSPFFILSVTTYGPTLAGMLSWETVMPHTLAGLYPPYPEPIVPVTVVATTTATTTPAKSKKAGGKASVATITVATTTAPIVPVFIASFRDEVVANHDVRVYRDARGRSVLLYGYWNQTTLVIARNPNAFTEILQRLATSRPQ